MKKDEAIVQETNALKEHLEDLDSYIIKENSELSKLFSKYRDDIKEASREAKRDDVIESMGIANKAMSRKAYNQRKEFAEKLEKVAKSPYFGRIDVRILEDKDQKTYYIGKVGFPGYKAKKQITDWRAPIASLYYNNPFAQKDVIFETTAYNALDTDKQIRCDLNIRRTIDIENRNLLNVYDDDLTSEISEKDGFLVSKLKVKSGGGLEDIIETIQKDQNQILRYSPFKNAIVQGVAGSGKTTIAIHRISFIFYNYKQQVLPAETLFLSNSKVLVNYLSKSLPELDIYNIKKASTAEFLHSCLEKNQIKLKKPVKLFSSKKGSLEPFLKMSDFIEILDTISKDINLEYRERLEEALEDQENDSLSGFTGYIQKFSDRPVFELINTINEDLKDTKDELKNDISYSKKNGLNYDYNVRKLEKINSALKKISKLMSEIKIEDIYRGMLQEKYGVRVDEYEVNHVSAIYYLALKAGLINNRDDFSLVLVDEAQDLNMLNLLCIRSFSKKNCFNFFGDLNQSVTKKTSMPTWETVTKVFGHTETSMFELFISYRSSRQIIEKAVDVLASAGITSNLPVPVSRESADPVEKKFTSQNQAFIEIVDTIRELRTQSNKSIGIVLTDDVDKEHLKELLIKSGIESDTVSDHFDNFKKDGVFIVPLRLVKGLEFDTVIALNFNSEDFADKIEGPYKKFVVITRAMSNLFLYSL